MADGSFRFHQHGAGQYYHQQHTQQVYQQRHLNRNGSPVNGAGAGYSNDTPSPSRSPTSQTTSHNPFGMFNQNHQAAPHTLMNGNNSHQRYVMNVPHKFQHQPHQQIHHHQQNHSNHPGHVITGHQHSFSGVLMPNATGNLAPNALQSGSPKDDQEEAAEGSCENWQEQLGLLTELRQSAGASHRHSKKPGAVSQVRGSPQASTEESQRDREPMECNRAISLSEDSRIDWDGMDLSGQGLRILSIHLFNDYQFLTKLFIDHNRLSSLPRGISQLRNLEHLNASFNAIRELPNTIGMLVRLKELLIFENKIQSLPNELGYLYRLETLGIADNPLQEDLKALLVHQGTQPLIAHLRDRAEGGAPPAEREVLIIDETETAETFTVFDYNILCDKYATTAQYRYTPTKALSWSYRKELILAEIKQRDADIVCLQEVDMESFNEYFRRELAIQKYKGVFWPKSRARTMADKEAKLVDGCATFYKGHKFIMLDKQLIDFANTAINRPDMKGEHDIFNRVMPRDNIAVVSFFENRMTGSRLIVVNAHIYWDPAFTDVKLVQAAILMEQVTKLADKWSAVPPCTDKSVFRYAGPDGETEPETSETRPEEPGPSLEYSSGSHIPLVICGDFNSSDGSSVHALLENGSVPSSHPDLSGRNYGNFTRDGMSHPFSLRSAYDQKDIEEKKRLPFTNYTPGFSAFIDYIWHSTNSLKVRKLLGKVDDEYLQTVPGFPHFHVPSDHLALFAEFSVEPRKERPKAVEADFGRQTERRS